MKKKNLLFAGFVALLFVGVLSYSDKANAQVVIEIPDFEEEEHCVCKQQGCSKGSWFSFRKSCTIDGAMCIDNGVCD